MLILVFYSLTLHFNEYLLCGSHCVDLGDSIETIESQFSIRSNGFSVESFHPQWRYVQNWRVTLNKGLQWWSNPLRPSGTYDHLWALLLAFVSHLSQLFLLYCICIFKIRMHPKVPSWFIQISFHNCPWISIEYVISTMVIKIQL
jgi:hypothetical protein